jgi:hypothetical protein
MSAQTHRKLDVRPRRRQVQEGADHAPVLLLVHGLSVLIHVERCSHTHPCQQGLRVIHLERLEDVLRVLGLMYKGSLLRLLVLKPEKELQFSHHRHLELVSHILCKPRNQRVRRAAKDNIIHVYLNN